MSDLDPKRTPDHLERAFLRPSEPEPFWKTKEFGRFAALAGVALFSLLLFAYFGLRQAEQAERDAELAKAAWPALTAVERQTRLDAQTNLFDNKTEQNALYEAIDAVKNKYGKSLLRKARTIKK